MLDFGVGVNVYFSDDAMVDGERRPLLLCLILFLVGEYHENGILPDFFRVQTAKVIIHKRFNCLVNVINYSFEFVVFVGVDLSVNERKYLLLP